MLIVGRSLNAHLDFIIILGPDLGAHQRTRFNPYRVTGCVVTTLARLAALDSSFALLLLEFPPDLRTLIGWHRLLGTLRLNLQWLLSLVVEADGGLDVPPHLAPCINDSGKTWRGADLHNVLLNFVVFRELCEIEVH